MNSFATNGFLRGMQWHHYPCLIFLKSLKFIIHSVTPIAILYCMGKRIWFCRWRNFRDKSTMEGDSFS